MSIRSDASGDILKRTANLPTTAGFAAFGRAKFASIRADYQYLIELASGTTNAGSYLILGFRNATTFEISAASVGVQSFSAGPAAGRWFEWALTSNGTTLNGYWQYPQGALNTASMATESFTPAQLSICNDSWNEWCDILMQDVIVYNAVPAANLIPLQMRTPWPLFANLNLWTPLNHAGDYYDRSGRLSHWTPGGTLTTGELAPVTRRSWMVPFVVAAGGDQSVTVADTGAGADALARLAVALALADTGAGSDAFGAAARLAASDTGAGADALARLLASLALAEAGTGADALANV